MEKLDVRVPFQITRFCSAYDYHWNSDFRFVGERHDYWELVCVLDGEVEIVENQNVYLCHKGDFACHAPMEFHRIRSSGGTSPHVLVMSFAHTGTVPASLYGGFFRLESAELDEYHALFLRLHRVYAALQEDPDAIAEVACGFVSFLIRLSGKHAPSSPVSESQGAAEYQRLTESMQSCVLENCSLQEIARRNAVSVGTVKNRFRTYAGIGPKAYYSQLRGREAIRLLEEGRSLTEIAEILNFSSVNYFSLFFKKQFGIPPGQYRREHRKA